MQLLGAAALVAAIVIHTPASAAADATAQAYRASCTSLLASVMEAAGKRLGEEEALNWITECARQAQAKCDTLPRTDEFCKGLREGF